MKELIDEVLPYFQHVNTKKAVAISCGIFVFGILFGYLIFPLTLKALIANNIGLKPGSEIRKLYTKVPFPVDFKVYVFNVTNKDEVARGGKPRLQEIGPYMFEEWKEKFDMTDDDTDDTLTFNMKNTFIFRPDLSNGLTGNEIITSIHPLIAGMSLAVNVDKKPMLGLVGKAIEEIFHHPKDPFWTGRFMDLFFNGIDIDCTSQEFEASAACAVFGDGQVKAIKPGHKEKFFKFSLFGGANDTGIGMYKVFRGIKNFRNVGRVISFDGDTEMDAWQGEECNKYKGTDSTIFPPLMSKEEGIWAYEPTLCLSLGAYYIGPSKYMGIPTLRYTIDFGDQKNDEKLQCYCMSPPDEGCSRKGTMNLFQCVGSPLIASMPHFYDADPELLRGIASGLNPNQKDHAIYLDFEIMSGTPVSAAKRLQFNIDIVPIPEVESMKSMPNVVLPMFWVEESAKLNQTYVDMVAKLFTVLQVVATIKWFSIVIGFFGGCSFAYIHYLKQNSVVLAKPAKAVAKVADIAQPEPKENIQPPAAPNIISKRV